MTTFLVIDLLVAYNVILGWLTLNKIRAVVSTYYQTVKFPTHAETGEITGSPQESRRCYLTAVSLHKRARLESPLADPRETQKPAPHLEPRGSTITVPLLEDRPEQTVRISISPDARPVKQKLRRQAPERQVAVREEVARLLEAGFIKEARYPQWLSNAVLAKKANGSWRMCVDYTSLNNACPKDCYPLPKVDQLVDATTGHARLSFMDAFSGYNQIKMTPEDQDHTAFLTDQGAYFYKVMPFGLKNAGATYQRTVNKMFAHQIGRNMEVYVDDMIVKSQEAGAHLANLTEAFATLRKFGMRLNPMKCAFSVTSGKFLGFIIHERGIDADPEKVQAIINMQSPRTIKDLLRLNGKLVAMSRFLARSGDRCLPFFRALKNPKGFQWTAECEEALKQMKQHLANLPRLASVSLGEKLSIYLAASPHAVSSVLVKEGSGEQLPVYYISHILNGPEERYPPIEKLALALILSVRKLRPYFQAHPVELGEHDIQYVPRTAIKAQSVTDFIAELTQIRDEILGQPPEAWVLHIDGSTNSKGAGAGLVLQAPDGRSFERSLRFGFRATNNEAEYETLLAGLKLALEMQVVAIRVLTDSQLVAEQLNGGYEARDPTMAKYLAQPPKSGPRSRSYLPAPSKSQPQPRVAHLLPGYKNCSASNGTGLSRLTKRQLGAYAHAWYTEVGRRLYKRSFSNPLLRCLEPDEARTVLAEVHEGVCKEHIGGRTLAHKILRQGYYWPTMCRDAKAHVQRCHSCQEHARTPRLPAVPLNPIDCAWPFTQWGLDLLGPFPPASGQRRYIVVGVDYFTKWVEAEPLATITERQIEKFMLKNLVTRFGLPNTIITEYGPKFVGRKFREFCANHGIQLRFSSVAHP
ncbi:uncharacterized protein LOC135680360 [Musa acuminata AAA Group]|uniref:uncharacterized protein LOC135680360 n=1 Tax=Musa acuminata AAA Group TaxID=214697 RepID=UPI0031D53C01